MRTLTHSQKSWLGLVSALILVLVGWQFLSAQIDDPLPPATAPIHPTFPLLDAAGEEVRLSGNDISAAQTCGSCHDVEFIANHSFHADAGLNSFTAAGQVTNGRAWDTSPGSFGRWNPFDYRYLSPASDLKTDLTTPEWLQTFTRHPGGGPAVLSRDGQPLTELDHNNVTVENGSINPETGALEAWDWATSGTAEMNCFMCHLPNSNNEARIEALQAGEFGSATTATLLGTGLVEKAADGWQWNEAAFDEQGNLQREFITLQDPTNANCGQCHGQTHTDLNTPFVLTEYDSSDYSTLTTGQIMSPQRVADSGLNLSGKADLARSFDIHTERVLSCTDCHYSLNNPVYFQEADAQRPDHLIFDPRRIDLGEYLYRPLHQFAKGQSAQSILATELDNTQRQCTSCHSVEATHDWLPFKEQHTTALSCESCHVPELYAPAVEYIDWTVLQTDGEPVVAYRGFADDNLDFSATNLLTGYEPLLLPRETADGRSQLAPYNLITAWYWVYGDPQRPVPLRDLESAWLDGENYHPDVLGTFDQNNDGQLTTDELVLDTDAKVNLLTTRLESLGLESPQIMGDVQPYSISHNVTTGNYATSECQSCHSEDSRLAQPFDLADRTPGGVMPTLLPANGINWDNSVQTGADGRLFWQPVPSAADFYILGHNSVPLVDWIGALSFIGVLAGVFVHGGLRVLAARRQAANHTTAVREVYMYDVYERLWHWLQTGAILLLLFTGLIIHKPDIFAAFSFRFVVQVHNVLAAILVINAALALFYHLASGEIRQYLPQPRGFFGQAVEQSLFYLRGIFRNDPHPFEKTRDQKLNPLQQITYFAILNLLLPLQILTGAVMWGMQQWPQIAQRLGGLPFLAPFHTLIAWLFATFIVMHVYLTTTGHTPLAGIKAMMLGWDEVEVHEADEAGSGEAAAPAD